MQPDFDRFFHDYAEAYNRSLGDRVDYDAIASSFADCFVAAGPDGVACGKNDDSFRAALDNGYAFYKSIGTRKMSVRRVEVTPIDDRHHMAKVHYRADYQKKSGETVSIDFDLTYMLQTRDGRSRIFAFVAGDEMGVYRRHGLVD
ncbi:MAG: nuclear transport factor 2 family protein [Rhizobiales bacterium]|nr:nuclear transport factor 2 family protein [Hyphomicrobiales bacterium]